MRFRELIEFQIERASEYYRRAFADVAAPGPQVAAPGSGDGGDLPDRLWTRYAPAAAKYSTERTSLTPLRKLWIAWRTWLTA